MTTPTTSPEEALKRQLHAASIAQEMLASGVPANFVLSVLKLVAQDYRSAYELLVLWQDANGQPSEQDETIADMQELLDDLESKAASVLKPYIPFAQLEAVGQSIIEFKTKLRALIDSKGGVSQVAEKSGIPQPSLSRMLNSASMPRRTTLYKIANAIGLTETEIVTDFSR